MTPGPPLTGEFAPATRLDRLALIFLACAFLSPFLMIGTGLVAVGLLALGPRRDVPELWIGLPAGAALLGTAAALLYYQCWRVPARTLSSFAFDGTNLEFVTPAHGVVRLPLVDVRAVAEARGRRGRLLGWWLRFDDAGWVFASADMPNAAELVRRLDPVSPSPAARP